MFKGFYIGFDIARSKKNVFMLLSDNLKNKYVKLCNFFY